MHRSVSCEHLWTERSLVALQGTAGGASGGGLGAMMGQMLRNPQIQQMALGMASQLEGHLGGAAQSTGEAGSDRGQAAPDLGGLMGMVNQVRRAVGFSAVACLGRPLPGA